MREPFDLNLRHLRALPLIAEQGSMSAAADAIGLSQPALAQGLAKLEMQFGASLFDRLPHGMRLTEAGARVIDRIRAVHARLTAAMRPIVRTSARGFERPENFLTATQARALLYLAEAGSFVAAARISGISQPAVHRAVRELEALCNAPLAERQGRGVMLTPQGQRLARAFRLVRAELAAALEEAHPGEGDSNLVIGAMPLCRALLLPAAVAELMRRNPSVHIDIAEGSFVELVEPLRDGRVDLLIGALRDPAPPDLAQLPLFVDRVAVVARAGHPLAGRERVRAGELARYPWVIGRKHSPLRIRWEALFADTGLPRPPAPVECGSVMATRGILLGSDLLTLLSPDQVAPELRADLLTTIATELPATMRTIGVITRADWRPTLVQSQFVDLLANIPARERLPEIG